MVFIKRGHRFILTQRSHRWLKLLLSKESFHHKFLDSLARKRRRLESYPESKTVHKLADLVGRGKISVCAAAELASTIDSRLDFKITGAGSVVPMGSRCGVLQDQQPHPQSLLQLRLMTIRSFHTLPSKLLQAWVLTLSTGGTWNGIFIGGYEVFTISSSKHIQFTSTFKFPRKNGKHSSSGLEMVPNVFKTYGMLSPGFWQDTKANTGQSSPTP